MKSLACDSEYSPDGTLLTLGLATAKQGMAWEQPIPLGLIKPLLARTTWLLGHSVTGDVDQLVKLGLAKPEWVDGSKTLDSLLLARMVDENFGRYDLEMLFCFGHDVEPWKYKTDFYDKTDATKWPIATRKDRCRMDAWASAVLVEETARQITTALRTFTHRVAATIHRIYLVGAFVDVPSFEKMGTSLVDETSRTRDLLVRIAQKAGMKEFSPTKDRDLRELLYKRLNLKCSQKTKGGLLSVAKSALKQHRGLPAVKLLLEFNTLDKQLSTWYGNDAKKTKSETLKQLIERQGGVLHFNINPLGARTGRRSSSRPNSQNWPKKVRSIIKSRWEGGGIGDFDYSRLEVILMGWIAKEPKLLEYFGKDGPGYIGIAQELFRKKVVKDDLYYRTVKALVLGINYGMGPFKLAYQLWWDLEVKLADSWERHLDKATTLRENYLARFPGIKKYMATRKREVLATGQVVSITGRVRHLPCPQGEQTEGFGHILNEGINFPIQSLAADITGSAMIDVERALCDEYHINILDYHSRLLAGDYPKIPLLIDEIHDDLVFDLPTKKDVGLIKETMEAVPTLRKLCPEFIIPLSVNVSIGSRWGLNDKN